MQHPIRDSLRTDVTSRNLSLISAQPRSLTKQTTKAASQCLTPMFLLHFKTHLLLKNSSVESAAILVPAFRRAVVQHALGIKKAHPALPWPSQHRRECCAALLPLARTAVQACPNKPYSTEFNHFSGVPITSQDEGSDLRRNWGHELCGFPCTFVHAVEALVESYGSD